MQPHERAITSSQVIGPALISLVFFFFGILYIPLAEISGSSEAREAQVMSALLRADPSNPSEILLPLRNGLIPSKPPLFHWVGGVIGSIAGDITPFIARLPSLFFGTCLLFCTLKFTQRFLSLHDRVSEERSSLVLLTTAFILTTMYGYTSMATLAMVDMTYAFFVCCAVFSLLGSLQVHPQGEALPAQGRTTSSPIPSTALNSFFVCAGLATLTKGPIGIVLPGVLAFSAIAYLFSFRSAVRTFFTPCLGWLLFIAIAAPWYVVATMLGSDSFVERQVWFENIQRVTGGEHMKVEPFWFYLPAVIRLSFPWSIVALCSAFFDFKAGAFKKRTLKRAVLIMVVVGILLFSVVAGKRHSYLLPLYPFLAVYVSWSLRDVLNSVLPVWWNRRIFILKAFTFLFLALLLVVVALPEISSNTPFTSNRHVHALLSHFESLGPTLRAAVGISLFALFLIHGLAKRFAHELHPNIMLYSTSLAIMFAVTMNIFSAKAFFKAYPKITSDIVGAIGTEPLFVIKAKYEETFDPIFFYLKREVTIVDVTEAHSIPGGGATLARKDLFTTLPEVMIMQLKPLDRVLRDMDDRTLLLFRKGSGRELIEKIKEG